MIQSKNFDTVKLHKSCLNLEFKNSILKKEFCEKKSK